MKFLQDKTIASLRNHSSYSSNPLVASYFCRCKDEVNPPKKGYKFTNQPLKDLGIRFTPAHEYLYEAVKSLQEKGFLPKASITEVKEKYCIENLRSMSIRSGIRVCISYIQLS